jgi:hypothetical protein
LIPLSHLRAPEHLQTCDAPRLDAYDPQHEYQLLHLVMVVEVEEVVLLVVC